MSSSSRAGTPGGSGIGPGAAYTIVRIKRKATEPPLSSLVIQDGVAGFGTPKKRRDVAGRARGVFRLADTVPDSWVGRGAEGEVLKERIRGLMGSGGRPGARAVDVGGDAGLGAGAGVGPGQIDELGNAASRAPGAGLRQMAEQTDGAVGATDPALGAAARQGHGGETGSRSEEDRGTLRAATSTETDRTPENAHRGQAFLPPLPLPQSQPQPQPQATPITPPTRTSSLPGITPFTPTSSKPSSSSTAATALQNRFRVVPPPRPERVVLTSSGLPRVFSKEEVEALRNPAFRFVDAQAVPSSSSFTRPSASGSGSGSGSRGSLTEARADGAEAGRGAAEEDSQMAAFQDMLSEYLRLENEAAVPSPAETEEYVYDLYFRDVREGSAGLTGSGDVGALLGFDELSPPSSPSDSEPEDEADEDSNDEDYYRNDYPEDEDADEDMQGFDDAFASDGESDEGAQSDGAGERGGMWDYR